MPGVPGKEYKCSVFKLVTVQRQEFMPHRDTARSLQNSEEGANSSNGIEGESEAGGVWVRFQKSQAVAEGRPGQRKARRKSAGLETAEMATEPLNAGPL